MKLSRYMTNLEHFAVVVECGTISAASAKLNLSQSALTRSIQRLEDVLGAKLLLRKPRGVIATAIGTVLLHHVQTVRNELEHAETALMAAKGRQNGRIACGAATVTTSRILPLVLGRIHEKLKTVQVSITDGRVPELLSKLRAGELDIVIGIEQPGQNNTDLRCDPLLEEHFGFFARKGHDLSKRGRLGLDQVVGHDRFVMPILATTPVEQALELELDRVGASLNPYRIETLSLPVFSHLVLEQDYVALSSTLIFGEELRSGRVIALPGDWAFPPMTTCIYRRRNDYDPVSLRAFVREVRAVASGIHHADPARPAAAMR